MQRIYNTISLAYKAKKLILGSDDVIRTVKRGSNCLILISSNASINTFKMIQNKIYNYNVEYIVLNDINNNFDVIFKGKKIKVIAIEDNGFKKLIKANLKE